MKLMASGIYNALISAGVSEELSIDISCEVADFQQCLLFLQREQRITIILVAINLFLTVVSAGIILVL